MHDAYDLRMSVPLDGSRPTYLQVADALRAEITSGALQPGDRVPSVRDLAARFAIATVTGRSALRVLSDEGYIAASSTRGYFVRDELPDITGNSTPSDEFVAISRQLDVVQEAMRELAARVNHLEEAMDARPRSDGDRPGASTATSPADD